MYTFNLPTQWQELIPSIFKNLFYLKKAGKCYIQGLLFDIMDNIGVLTRPLYLHRVFQGIKIDDQ